MEIGFRIVVPRGLAQQLYDELEESSAIENLPPSSSLASRFGLSEDATMVRMVADTSNLGDVAGKILTSVDAWREASGRGSVSVLVQGGNEDAVIMLEASTDRAAAAAKMTEAIQK
jgi:hypothetical protein